MILIEIRCDKCDRAGDSGPYKKGAFLLRSVLRRAGWVNTKSGKDYCPDCVADMAKDPA